ncbi:unnamed protein product [Lepeophtheirus salmonis]|uniref:(salmon louse) hypothetical protein n=1 Tax=Lepeophtheirus salmonis TaxID=72036 RepID=A0A7R8CU43_LEPSM|nr:unnamed protein product [Lepeophtheirus salmonis]CAF2932061.1 unnamed protein product [Lepeophtheirus salmonis]
MSSSDRTFTKVALYSAVVAGFAYVGYKVVKESINKWKPPQGNGKLYVRRLSGSDILLENLENAFSNGRGEYRIRPFNVKERIKDLNLQALQFADTVMALEKPSPPGVTRSLSSTPLGSPKHATSPVEFRVSCPERLLQLREEELKHRLQDMFHKPQKLLTPYEAKCLVALLHTEEVDVLEKSLVTLLKCTAFSDNQKTLRDVKVLRQLQPNMALNLENQPHMDFVIPSLVPIVLKTRNEDLLLNALIGITNLIVLDTWIKQIDEPFLIFISGLILNDKKEIRLQALKLLANVSSYECMINLLLKSMVLLSVGRRLCEVENEDEILRMTTVMANALPFIIEHLDESMHKLLFEKGHLPEMKKKLYDLMKTHPHEDIKKNSRICYMAYKPIGGVAQGDRSLFIFRKSISDLLSIWRPGSRVNFKQIIVMIISLLFDTETTKLGNRIWKGKSWIGLCSTFNTCYILSHSSLHLILFQSSSLELQPISHIGVHPSLRFNKSLVSSQK